MAPSKRYSVETEHDFVCTPGGTCTWRNGDDQLDKLDVKTSFTEMFLGLAIFEKNEKEVLIGAALNDGTYSADFAVYHISLHEDADLDERLSTISNQIIDNLARYEESQPCKILGAGITETLDHAVPYLCSRLWFELDIVPIVFRGVADSSQDTAAEAVDELADFAARRCLSVFGPNKQPRLSLNYTNEVEVDVAGRIRLATSADYESSVRKPTWRAVQKYIQEVKDHNLRIVFFSATPQGGGVALMRHALLRFLRQAGLQVEWFVPRPKPDIFRITKTNHNILQGVVSSDVRSSDEQLQRIKDWIDGNADRYWLKKHGPLKSAAEGGADLIIVDDPQMPQLIEIAKREDPNRTVLFRSHIEVRDDLVHEDGSAAQQVWKSMWPQIKKADMFISHPVSTFVPSDVDHSRVAWLPATTDWLDGLNKPLSDWDAKYYLHQLRQACDDQGAPHLAYPKRPYMTQVARFDPSKGIPDLVKSYAKFREMLTDVPTEESPQLVICGHASIDDPDGTIVYDQTVSQIQNDFPQHRKDIVVVRLGPSDQLLNAIMSRAKVALQLSTREGFEVKVSEALHMGKPIIATRAGGIPLQVEHGKSGYIVERGDHDAVAKHMYDLFTDDELYTKMSSYARDHVSDEVHTVGNALSWLYLAAMVARGEKVRPDGRWLNDMAREAAEEPYEKNEPRLARDLSTPSKSKDDVYTNGTS